jgi:predicted HicB family RNase H-like nuclease
MNTLQYRDYQGAVTFEDDTLVIQILHIDDYITTTCDTASGAQAAFEELVNDYIETCKVVGKQPSKPFKGTFNIRIGSSLHRNAAVAAADCDETLNAWIVGAVEQRLRKDHLLKAIKDAYRGEAWAPQIVKVEHRTAGIARVVHDTLREALHAADSHVGSGRVKVQEMLELGSGPSPWQYLSRDQYH